MNHYVTSGALRAAEVAKQGPIGVVAASQEGSTDWAYNKAKGTLRAGTNKCTLFVHDSLNDAGVELLLQDQGYSKWIPFMGEADTPYTAEQWTNGDVPGFHSVSQSRPGDVASYARDYSDATGHAGIVGFNSAGELGVFNANSRIVQWSSFEKFFDGEAQRFMRYSGD
ncbi:hypothetical protein N480_00010 [Pseudoalteromonas luteoviolacea S2607]|uniref:hypothetical protein n=1 Tax=Pseudoalteromonas luteoviolacea TaxID=43657 RepID=UPI0007B03D9F|nr:hypothetical protein [Pseudoalteromonas luteoviolacea]KZN39243.1 hypothetical protein N480_00010 [Pseudoalteromonas luteoviolacea S2607]